MTESDIWSFGIGHLTFDISSINLSGREAGILRFDFTCLNQSATPRIQVFWWGDSDNGRDETLSIRFTADNGTLIVPLDATPLWLMLKRVKGISIDLDNASACDAIKINNVRLMQRLF
jgi:hypothetical protein